MQNTVCSKTNLNLTNNLWGKGAIPAIGQRHNFVSQRLLSVASNMIY